jgi:hypothetical protein
MANFATLDLSRATLMESLTALAGVTSRGVTFYDTKGRPERLSYAELWERALRFAAGLRKLEMAPGDPLVLILTDPKEAIIAILGSIAAGCPPAPVYPPVSAQAIPAFLRLVGRRRRRRVPVPRHAAAHLLDGARHSAVRRGGRVRDRHAGERRAGRPRVPAVHVGVDVGAEGRLGHAPVPRYESVDDS